ncbi:MAG TPA: ROK family protein [Verrucomicrobiae bacterium]
MGGTQIKMAAFSPEGKMVEKWTCQTNDQIENGIPLYAETARRMLSEIAAPDACIGIATPGLVAKDGRSIASQPGKMQGIEKFDWTDFLHSKSIIPVLNDAHAALLGEVWQGAAKGCRHAILLTLGTGVGGAILSDGKLLKGVIGRAGHLGHVSINENEDLSIFGMPGSLEAAVGNYNVTRRTGGRFASSLELEKAYLAGDVEAKMYWLKSIRDLARAIASFVNILDPEIVIVGGGIAKSGKNLFQPLADFMEGAEWRPGGHRVRIVPAVLGEWAGTYGAAWNTLNFKE